jgi:hypothetical protein
LPAGIGNSYAFSGDWRAQLWDQLHQEDLGAEHGPEAHRSLGVEARAFHSLAIPEDLLVIVAVRNAKDWARSMFSKPWHTRASVQKLEFSEFLRSPWKTVIDRPRYFEGMTHGNEAGRILQLDRDVLTGLPYPNLFALREGKLFSHLSFSNRGCTFCLVQMEFATKAPDAFVEQMLAAFSLPPLAAPLKPVHKRLGSRFVPSVEARPELPEGWAEADMAFLKDNVNAELEALLGYSY